MSRTHHHGAVRYSKSIGKYFKRKIQKQFRRQQKRAIRNNSEPQRYISSMKNWYYD